MSEYTHTTSTTTRQPMLVVSQEPVTGTTLLEASFGGKVTFSKVRGSGTLRHWPVLAKGSAQRSEAEGIEKALKAKGATVAKVASDRNVSVATLRRSLTALAFTRELEGMSAKDRAALAKVATANGKVAAAKAPKEQPKAEEPKATPAPKEQQPKARSSRSAAPKGTKANPGKGGFVATTKQGKAAVARKAERSSK